MYAAIAIFGYLYALDATHDDILFAPHKTSEIWVTQARMHRNGETQVLIENYEPSNYILGLRK